MPTHPIILSREVKKRSDMGVFIELKVYNIQVKEVATLVNKQQKSDNYKATFNANNLPSGVYFYQLKTSGFTKTKKMLLLE